MRARSHKGEEFCRRLSAGQLQFQRCNACQRLQYPPAEICRECLSAELAWSDQLPAARVIACVAVHHCYAEDFVEGGPWWVASVTLAPGVTCYAHALAYLPAGTEVTLAPVLDRLGDGVLAALKHSSEREQIQSRFSQE
ncbi:MAG: Zn-ribbon domain-containing OB-fold protein [Gammaproteobacteria bacterium]